jgi:hypothetical protein
MKIVKTFAYLIWCFFSQVIQGLIFCKTFINNPNLVKMAVLSYWLWQTIKIYRGLTQVAMNLKLATILDKSRADLPSLRVLRGPLPQAGRPRSRRKGVHLH